jgi:hypothetical protein
MHFLENVVIVDQFGQEMSFVLPGNRDRYKSLLGSILTFVMAATILTYASIRINTFKDPSESTIF